MPQTIESMRRRIESAEDLYAVVRVMKALAAANIRQCELAVESLAEYNRTTEAGLQVVLQQGPREVAIEAPTGKRWGIIVFGSDQGMCGSFNEQVATFALEQIDAHGENEQDRTILVVGRRLERRLEDARCPISDRFRLPSTISGITSAVHEVLLKVEQLRFEQGLDQFLLIHHRPAEPTGFLPDTVQLLPLDSDWLESLAERPWPSRTVPMFTMDWRRLFSALVRQHLFVSLYRAFAESLASENSSRLSSMHAAEKNIQDHLSQLTSDYHQARQQSITEELLDIVAGFETLTKEEERRAARLHQRA